MNQDQYFQAFFELLREAKIVEHLIAEPSCDRMSYDDFRDRVCDLLSRLSDDDLKAVANKIKASRYFNIVIQAQIAAVNLQAKERGWECLI
jgi:hypothetical protein